MPEAPGAAVWRKAPGGVSMLRPPEEARLIKVPMAERRPEGLREELMPGALRGAFIVGKATLGELIW